MGCELIEIMRISAAGMNVGVIRKIQYLGIFTDHLQNFTAVRAAYHFLDLVSPFQFDNPLTGWADGSGLSFLFFHELSIVMLHIITVQDRCKSSVNHRIEVQIVSEEVFLSRQPGRTLRRMLA